MRLVRVLAHLTLVAIACGFAFVAQAGIRGPGKYCGVVVFDRWDTCFLLSGPYITYVSEKVKNVLRPYRGQAVQVDALEVFQPINPGDALIRESKIIGPAPKTRSWFALDGLELSAESDFGPEATPHFVIQIRNVGDSSVRIDSSEIAPVLISFNPHCGFCPSDGASAAVITRVDLLHSHGSTWEYTMDGVSYSIAFAIDPATQPPDRFDLLPGQSMRTKLTFQVSPGQYQFLFGYGGGVHEERSLASNAIPFDIGDGGVATLAE
jgi:hypothetical protein